MESPPAALGQPLLSSRNYHTRRAVRQAFADILLRHIADARQRIEVYRKLAQATDQAGLRSLKQELRDRFGPLLPPLELLLQVADLKVQAKRVGHHGVRGKGVSNRQTGWQRWNMGLSAEDFPEVRVQGIEPDLF